MGRKGESLIFLIAFRRLSEGSSATTRHQSARQSQAEKRLSAVIYVDLTSSRRRRIKKALRLKARDVSGKSGRGGCWAEGTFVL